MAFKGKSLNFQKKAKHVTEINEFYWSLIDCFSFRLRDLRTRNLYQFYLSISLIVKVAVVSICFHA